MIGLGICDACRRASYWKFIRANGATVMFGKPTQFCLDPRQCFCNTYGYCDMSDEDLRQQWQWRGQSLPEGWPNVPEAPTQAQLAGEPEAKPEPEPESESESEPVEAAGAEAEAEAETNKSHEQPPDQSAKQRKSDRSKRSSWKRSLALADEMPDISDASRQALRDASV